MRQAAIRRNAIPSTGLYVLAGACAVSAGVHAGLVHEHLREAPWLGVSFGVAAGLLLGLAAGVVIRPGDRRVIRVAQLLIAVLLAAYVASRTAGIPGLDVEPVDRLGVATKAVEVLALLCTPLAGPTSGDRRSSLTQEVAR